MPSLLRRSSEAIARRCLGTVTQFKTTEPVAALTFDDGPDAQSTPRVLTVLERYGARGTFFVVGEAAAAQPALVARMAAVGHTVANHTWSHQSIAALNRSDRRREIRACAHAISPHGKRFFRPPWGEQTRAGRMDTFLLRHEVVGWNVDVDDWRNPHADEMSDALIARVQPGSIVLLHDCVRIHSALKHTAAVEFSREAMISALTRTLEQLTGRIRFVTIPEMFRHGKPVRRFWLQTESAVAHAAAQAARTTVG